MDDYKDLSVRTESDHPQPKKLPKQFLDDDDFINVGLGEGQDSLDCSNMKPGDLEDSMISDFIVDSRRQQNIQTGIGTNDASAMMSASKAREDARISYAISINFRDKDEMEEVMAEGESKPALLGNTFRRPESGNLSMRDSNFGLAENPFLKRLSVQPNSLAELPEIKEEECKDEDLSFLHNREFHEMVSASTPQEQSFLISRKGRLSQNVNKFALHNRISQRPGQSASFVTNADFFRDP